MSVVQCIKAYNEVSSIDCCSAGDVFKQDVVSNLLLLAAGKTCFFSSYIIICHRSRLSE